MSNQSKNSGGAKHTPGPWRVDHNRCLIHGPTELVARLAYTQQGTVQNGNLIAAAPAMYEALIECEVLLEEYPLIKRVVKQALAQAEGK